MTPTVYPIRQAGAADVDAIMQLRGEAEEWLRRRGIRQWTDDYHDYARAVLRASVDAGSAWVVEHAGRVIATVTVVDEADRDFWDPADGLAEALYLGKMIVARSHAGQDLGAAIMNWVSRRAKTAGKRSMRIDVRRDNHRLHRYYLSQGWRHVRTVDPPRRRTESGTLFQRPAGHITPARSVVETSDTPGRREPEPALAAGMIRPTVGTDRLDAVARSARRT